MSINKFYEDASKVLAGTISSCSDIKSEAKNRVSLKLEKVISKLNLVNREEIEVVKEMIVKAREENEYLKQKVHLLEKKVNSKSN